MLVNFPLNLKFRAQFWVGAVLALWLYLLLAFVGPFDAAELSLRIRSFLMIGYSLIFWGTYLLCIPLQQRLHRRFKVWDLKLELFFLSLFIILCFAPTYAYYRTDAVNGTFSVTEFASWVYLPTTLVLIPILLVSRYTVGLLPRPRIASPSKKHLITLTGSNKQDILRISWTVLVAISAADNYITVYYLEKGEIQKCLLRSTLRKVAKKIPDLVQIHRSHLINPTHFRSWQDGKFIQVNELVLPVSKKYKAALTEVLKFAPL